MRRRPLLLTLVAGTLLVAACTMLWADPLTRTAPLPNNPQRPQGYPPRRHRSRPGAQP